MDERVDDARRRPVEAVADLVAELGIRANRDQVSEILQTGVGLATDRTERLNLKIAASALGEMRDAFSMFAPYRDHPKVTIFGSARTRSTDPTYAQTHDVAEALAAAGWMVVTGAGPGIMQAAMEGAGRRRSIGVSIRLPFESRANDVIHNDPKHVSMKYFFTRKLMLVKESKGFVAVPGGFGTLDETLELLTLQQTGKAEPTPIVLLDAPGERFWHRFDDFVREEMGRRGLITDGDMDRVLITDSVEAATEEILGFWRNYHSMRWEGARLVLRIHRPPSAVQLDELNRRFADRLATGRIEVAEPLPSEVADRDQLHLARLVMVWDPVAVGELHQLIRAVNELG